jgi:tetratricopeptide (TPR) repeat protein
VQAALDALVALKLEPEKNAEDLELYEHYRSYGYPTILFATADGEELDRFGDFMPAKEFLATIDRIKAGDTFAARLARLDQDPGSFKLLEPVYDGLMVRGDFAGVFSRIDAFRVESPELHPDPSMPLLQRALMSQHGWLYRGAARLYRNDWEDEIPEIEEPRAGPSLMGLLEESFTEMPKTVQAERLRKACVDDAATILEMTADQDLPPDRLFANAEFAFENGLYDLAADLYTRWFEAVQDPHPGNLNQAAWNLFLSGRDIEQAIAIARAAYALDTGPSVADTLAQLLYVNGEVNKAIEIERRAAAEAERGDAEGYAAVVALMEAGEEMVDRPDFDTYPD